MTDRYGAYRGALLQASPPKFPNAVLGGEAIKRLALDSIELSSAAIADRIWVGNFSLDTRLDPASTYYYDALAPSTTLSLGDITYPAGLASAASTASAGSRSAMASVDIANYPKPLWAQLGYASREDAIAAQPHKDGRVDIWLKVGGAVATGTVSWHFKGCEA